MLAPLLVAFAFLTRLPLGGPMLEPARLGRAVALFPLVGLVLGGALAASGWLLRAHLPAELAAFALLVGWVLATGALHLDGVADLGDALAGGRGDRERTLSIMKDSRIGAIGASVLVLNLLGKWLALAAVLRASLVWPLLVAPVGARWLAVYLLARYPSARPDGLAFALSSATSTRHLAQATALFALALAVAGARVALTVIPALLAGLALAAFVKRRIAGITGDVIGAAIELVELVALMAAVWQ